MKKRQHRELISLLQAQHGPLSSTLLANSLGVSRRTVRTYVSEINASSSDSAWIVASSAGYQLNPHRQAPSADLPKVANLPVERRRKITQRLLSSHDQVDIYSLSDLLCVSDATIEYDLKMIKQHITAFNLQLERTKDKLKITGDEYDKRRVMGEIVYQELDQQFLQIASLKMEDTHYDLQQLKTSIESILTQHQLFYNGYTINNILLHIIIAIERIKNDNNMTQQCYNPPLYSNEYQASQSIAKMLNQQFNLPLNEHEIYYLALILLGKTSIIHHDAKNIDDNKLFIEQRVAELTGRIIHKVKQEYLIDLTGEDFFVRFALHIQNMISRLAHKRPAKNPLSEKIKSDYPLIYDAAVLISDLIGDETQLTIGEDEIAYIAFHIGSFFENQKKLEDKVSAVLVCPKYHDMHSDLLTKLLHKVGDSLEITEIITSMDLHQSVLPCDVILSTLPLQTTMPLVILDSFLKEKDIANIYQLVEKIKKDKYKKKMKSYLQRFFSPSLFSAKVNFKNENEAIAYMCEQLTALGYVKPTFIEHVLQRESLSPTSFNNNIALPHAIGINAYRSTIAIAINQQPMLWGKYKVQIIVLIAMSEQDRHQFRQLFDLFIEVLSEQENIKLLVKAKSYEQFMAILLPLMKE